jgi:type I restriction enzyme S subunit
LGEVFRRLTTKNSENNGNILTISAQLGLVSQLEYFNKRVAAKDLTGYYLLHRGDFAYNKSYSKGYPMGAIKPLRMHEKGVVSTLYICFRVKDGFRGAFFEHYFESGLQNSEIEKIAKEGGRAHGLLNVGVKDFFEKINLFIPEEDEQQKIADCLTSIDALIAAQAEKIDALKTHKEGLMQQLFPRDGETVPQLRFPEFRDTEKWKNKILGELVEVASGQVDPTKSPYSDMPHVGGDNIESHTGTIKELKTASELGLISGKYLFDRRDVLYSKIRPALNKVASPDFDGICSADIYPIRPGNQELCRKYLAYVLLSNSFLRHATKNSDRSKIPKVNRESLLAYELVIPCRTEQKRIADCLSSLDTLITVQSEKLESLKTHKKGLMQQLFPSPEAGGA